MRKIIINIFAYSFGLFSFVACSNFLNEKPDFATSNDFFTSADNLKIGLTAVYDGIGYGKDWENFFYNRFVFECRVGYQVGWEKGPLSFQNGQVDPSIYYIDYYWRICYENINRANQVIQQADQLIANNSTPNDVPLLSRMKGEALFLRAFYYFNLVRYFDNIPVKITPTLSENDYVDNENGKRTALDLIQQDLKLAASLLPTVYTGDDRGRATKWAAETLLMKAYLQDEKWKDAYSVSKHIIDSSGLSLFSDFSWNFSKDHENEGERIFEAQSSYAANPNENNDAAPHFAPRDLPTELGGISWGWVNGTKAFRLKYLSTDKRIPGTFLLEYPTNRTKKNSKGQYPTIKWDSSVPYTTLDRYAGMVDPNADPDDTSQLKFSVAWSAKWLEVGIPDYSINEKNIVYLRYADVLLGNAEAANEAGQGDPYYGINEVRKRAGIPMLTGLTKEQLRDAIVHERVLEFAFEQETYPELKRKSTWKGGAHNDYLGEYIQEFIRTYNVNRTLSPKDYVLPIPRSEILANPKIKQNIAYN